MVRTLRAGPYTRALAWEQEGTFVASLSADGNLQVWDIVSGKADCNMPKSAPKVRILPSACSKLAFLPRSQIWSKMLIYLIANDLQSASAASCRLTAAPMLVAAWPGIRMGACWQLRGRATML